MIYADNAATTKMSAEAFEVMRTYLLEDYGNASQPYFFSRSAKKALIQARETIASCIHAAPEEIFFTSGGTESDNWAIKAGNNREIVTSQIEHHAVLRACGSLERTGIPVTYLPADREGVVAPQALERGASGRAGLVSVMMVNNEIGTIEPISELAAIAHRRGALFHTDAVQAVGHIPINVEDIGVDMLSASAHKFNGPKGIGFLYIRKGTPVGAYMDGGSQEFGMRAGTENIAAIAAMARALEISCSAMAETAQKLRRMETAFMRALDGAGIDYLRNGAEEHAPGIISLSIRGASGETLLHRMDLKGICISTGSACNSVSTEVSHVVAAIGVPEAYAEGTIRISFGRDNSDSDAIEVASALVGILRKM